MAREQVLSLAVRVLTTSTTAEQAMSRLAANLVTALGDCCLVDVLEPPDLVTRVVALDQAGPLRLPPELGPVGARRSAATSQGVLTRLTESPGRLVRLSAQDVAAMAASDDPRLRVQGQLAQRLGLSDLLVAGLTSHDVLLGVLVLGRTRVPFDDEEIALVVDVAALAGHALDALRLLSLQRGVSTALQHSLLPRLPVLPGVGLTARFVAAGSGLAVGGDWYDVFVLPSGEPALVVGDATGHDVQAAARMAELRNLLRAVAVDRGTRPAATLSRVDELLGHLAPHVSGTCVYAQLSHTERGLLLRWSSAGHLPPVLVHDGRARLLETNPDVMLGVLPGLPRHDHERRLHSGDMLLLYTDGLVEERRTGLDERLRELLRATEQHAGDGPELLADRLLTDLAPGEDDVAVLVLTVGEHGGARPGRPSGASVG